MSGASGSDIQISITVVDKNGVATVQQLENAVKSLGDAGETGGQRAGNGMKAIGGHALTSLDNVRLLRDDLGIRIPRSMERAIAQSQLLSTAIGGIGTGLLAVGSVEIFARLGEGIYNAYEKYVSLTAVAQQYNEELAKKKDEDFINPHTIETAILRLNQATESAQKLHDVAVSMRGDFWSEVAAGFGTGGLQGGVLAGATNLVGSHGLEESSVNARGQADALEEKDAELQQRMLLGRIDLRHAGDADLKGLAQINAEEQKRLRTIEQQAIYARGLDSAKGNPAAQDAIGAAEHQQMQIAEVEANAKRAELARNEIGELEKLRAQALQAGLQGNALYYAQEQSEIDSVTRKFLDGQMTRGTAINEVYAIQDRFFGEAQKRQDELDAQTRKMEADAATAGLTGIARIQAENQAALAAIDERERKEGAGSETGAQKKDFDRQRAATGQSGAQKQAESERQYYEEMTQMMDGFVGHNLQGYAQIALEAQKDAEQVAKKWGETWGQMTMMDAGYLDSLENMAANIGQIYARADRDVVKEHQQTMDELRKEEELAARDSLPPWVAAELGIKQEFDDRLHKAKEIEDQQLAYAGANADLRFKIEQDYNARVTAAAAVANAQMQRQMEETRDKLASSLNSFFQNPAKFIENRAMETAFQYMANGMMQLFQGHQGNAGVGVLGWLFGMNGQASTSTNPGTFGHSLFSSGGDTTGFSAFSAGSSTLQTGALTLQTASQTLLQAAQSMMTQGGGAGVAADLGLPGFGGISSGSTSSDLGSAVGSAAAGGTGGGGGISDADMAQLAGDTGPNANGGFSSVGGGLTQGAAAAGGTTGKWMGVGGAAVTGAMGLYSAYENSDPVGGAISGAMSGAEIGTAFAPGVGTVIGALAGGVAGLLAGLFGDKGKGEAQDLDWKTIQPGIANELQQFNSGQTGYNQAAQYLDQLQVESIAQTNSWGSGARSWYSGHILPEIQAAQAQLAREEKGNRSLVGLSAAQYHTGGIVNDFGDLALNSAEGFILAKRGETMMTAAATSSYAPMLHAMNNGAITPAMLRGSQMVPAGAGAGGGAPIYISAWDAQSVQQWLARGGATQIRQGSNMATSQYGGKGVR